MWLQLRHITRKSRFFCRFHFQFENFFTFSAFIQKFIWINSILAHSLNIQFFRFQALCCICNWNQKIVRNIVIHYQRKTRILQNAHFRFYCQTNNVNKLRKMCIKMVFNHRKGSQIECFCAVKRSIYKSRTFTLQLDMRFRVQLFSHAFVGKWNVVFSLIFYIFVVILNKHWRWSLPDQ